MKSNLFNVSEKRFSGKILVSKISTYIRRFEDMRKHILTVALAGVLTLIVGANAALADYAFPQQPNQLAIRLGALFPTTNNAQAFGGTTQFLGGLDYTLSATRSKSPSSTGLYFDYQSGTQHLGYVHAGGLGLQFRTMWPAYVGAGLGIYNTAVRTPSGERSGNSTGGGGKVFLGYELGNRAMVQVDYHIVPTTLGVNPNGLGLEFGFRL
jgi:hypothetical protein